MRLLLFDIDGTLVHTDGCGRRALTRALDEILGINGSLDSIGLSGRTDLSLLREVFTKFGHNFTTILAEEILARYVGYLSQEIQAASTRKHWILPGVRSLLYALEGKARLGVATGNVEQGARLKLQSVEIDGFFPVGGFGSDAEARSLLVQAGAEKARRFYQEPLTEVFVIGDTPLDIYAAKENHFVAVGVATGVYSFDTLKEAGADLVLRSFEAHDVLDALLD